MQTAHMAWCQGSDLHTFCCETVVPTTVQPEFLWHFCSICWILHLALMCHVAMISYTDALNLICLSLKKQAEETVIYSFLLDLHVFVWKNALSVIVCIQYFKMLTHHLLSRLCVVSLESECISDLLNQSWQTLFFSGHLPSGLFWGRWYIHCLWSRKVPLSRRLQPGWKW